MLYAVPNPGIELSLAAAKRAGEGSRLPSAMAAAEHTDLVIFRQFLAGDTTAFTSLYERHNQRLFIYCIKIVHDNDLAEDIAHSVWERMIRLRGELQDVGNPLGFLYRTARNLCFDHLKHLKYQTSLNELPDAHHPTASASELTSEQELVITALEELPPETKEILILHYYSGYTAEEIAMMLDKSPNAIWTRISRARVQLKNLVEKGLARERRITE